MEKNKEYSKLEEQTASDTEAMLSAVEKTLISIVDALPAVPQVKDAVRHSLFPAGKRIRPLVALSLAADLGGDWPGLLVPAGAIELTHCASLVHDDLPALDNDDLRRGRPSCHKAFGEATAILTGDLMVSHALLVLARSQLAPALKLSMVELLSHGFVDVCNGQQLDLLPPDLRGNLGDVLEVHKLKTGALFSVATCFAGLAAQISESAQLRARELGLMLGVLFQVLDDYLDRIDPDHTGRTAGSDARNGRTTAFSAGSIEQGRAVLDTATKSYATAREALAAEVKLDQFPRFDRVVAMITGRIHG